MIASQNHNGRKRVWIVEHDVMLRDPRTGRRVRRRRALVRWRNFDGKVEQRTFADPLEAGRYAARKKDELQGLLPTPVADCPLFSEWVDTYLGARYPVYARWKQGLEEKPPQRGYVSTMLQAVKPFLEAIGDRPLIDYRPTDFERFRGLLLAEGKRAPMTIETFLQRLKVFFSAAEAEGLIPKKPKIQVRRVHYEKPVLEPEQITAIFTKARTWPDEKITHEKTPPGRLLPILATLYYTMMRRGELIHLAWDDLVYEKGQLVEIFVRAKQWEEPGPDGTLVRHRWEPKDHESRAIPAHPALIPVLEELRAKRANPKWVFTDRSGGRWSEGGIASFVARFEKAIGYRVGFHQWRRSGLTLLHDAGTPIGMIKEIAGHSCISTTMRYVRPSANGRRHAIKGLPTI